MPSIWIKKDTMESRTINTPKGSKSLEEVLDALRKTNPKNVDELESLAKTLSRTISHQRRIQDLEKAGFQETKPHVEAKKTAKTTKA